MQIRGGDEADAISRNGRGQQASSLILRNYCLTQARMQNTETAQKCLRSSFLARCRSACERRQS
jgi:hypothetical protein